MNDIKMKMMKPLPNVFKQVSIELSLLHGTMIEIEHDIAALATIENSFSTHSITNLQKIDRVTQTLNALAEYTDSISKMISPDQVVNVAAAADLVLMSDVANRLRDCNGLQIEMELNTLECDFF